MSFLEYPNAIITILAAILLVMGLIGLYFMMKSVRASRETAEKNFCSMTQIESSFVKAGAQQKRRCLLYISMSLDSMKRLYPEARAFHMYEQNKKILLKHFCLSMDGEIAIDGDDNFVALNNLDEADIERCIEKCAEEMKKTFVKNGAVGVAHIYIGYHLTRSNEVSFDTILSRAKQACSMAEDQNTLHCRWDRANGKAFERKISIENTIASEIENNHFFLEYQPLVDAKTNKIIGAEVLARLNSPTEGVLAPGAFLSAVNNVGLNQKFDYYIFEKNCKWIANDIENRKKYVYTINFSRHTLCDPDLARNIVRIVEKYGIPYSCLAVEILEDKSVQDEEKTIMIQNLTILKARGILILLDDFGRGHTNFRDLADFDVSIVKIDRSIIQNADTHKGFLLLANIVRTARDLGFQTLCEGIETEAFKQLAEDADCDIFQGFYFYRPMSVTQLENLLDNQ